MCPLPYFSGDTSGPHRSALRAPFALGGKDALVRLFEGAGVESVGIETVNGTARFARSHSEKTKKIVIAVQNARIAMAMYQLILQSLWICLTG